MSQSPLEEAIGLAEKKAAVLKNSPMKFLTKAALAGAYIGFAVVFSFRVGEYLQVANSPVASLLAGMAFSLALVLIVIGSGELFTGNTMFLTMGTLAKRTTFKELLANWGMTYFGNLAGVFLFTGLFLLTGIFSGIGKDHFLMTAVAGKVQLSATEMFFRGILCNWLVCLAIWIPMQTKDFSAKVFLIMFIVTAFFLSGYEHSIANMALFSIALSLPHPDVITLSGTVYNLLIVSAGNIVGGGLFVGAAYLYALKETRQKSDHFPRQEKKAA